MSFRLRWLLVLALFALPMSSPAPLVYRAGEGWTYEQVGGGKWRRTRAKDQLEVAEEAYAKKQYSTALKAARRTAKVWPYSDHAPKALYLAGRCHQAKGDDEKAFKEYQKLLERYPKIENYHEVIQRQFEIANRYLAGKWFKLWGYIPFFPSMAKTSEMYEKLIKNGPYSDVAPQAQMNIGAAHEKKSDYSLAVRAYERAADRYHDRKEVAATALYKAGLAYHKQAKTAEYDQNVAGQAIATFSDFMTLYPDDPRVPEVQKLIASMKAEQARGNFTIAKYYEKRRRWDGALIYYNEVLIKDPESKFGDEARKRIEDLKKRTNRDAAKK